MCQSSVRSPRIVFVAVVVSQKSENLRKIWKSSKNLKIFQKSSKNPKIFQKSEIFPKIWNFSKNLKFFQKSESFPKICLIKCLKGHKSLGSLCSVVKTLIVSWVRQTDRATKGQGHLLSCSGQLKNLLKLCHETVLAETPHQVLHHTYIW